MSKLRRTNKDEFFKGQTPVAFSGRDVKFLDADSYNYFHGTQRESLTMLNLSDRGMIRSRSFYAGYGVLLPNWGRTVAAIATINTSGTIHIYYNEKYFEHNPSHKTPVNKFARELGLSLKKDITYISDGLINTWIAPFSASLEFYDEAVQAATSKEFFASIKNKYPLPLTENLVVNEG